MLTFVTNHPWRVRFAPFIAAFVGVVLACLASGSSAVRASAAQVNVQGEGGASCGFGWTLKDDFGIAGDYSLRDVAAIAPDDVWAVGWELTQIDRQALLLHWDGISWTKFPAEEIVGDISGLGHVSAIATDNVWAFGTNYDSFNVSPVHWDGSTWTVFPDPDVQISMSDAVAISSTDMWVVGQRSGSGSGQLLAYAYHWDGSDWTAMPVPGGSGATSGVDAITAIASDDVWVAGYSTSGSGSAFTSHWDGSAWAEVALPSLGTSSSISDLDATATDDVWAVGSYYAGEQRSLILHWNGTDWGIEDALGNNPHAVVAFAPDDVWALGTGPFFLAQHLDPYFGWGAAGGNDIYPGSTLFHLAADGVAGEVWVVGMATTDNKDFYGFVSHYGETTVAYADVAEGNAFFPYINCLSCAGIITGYPCGGAGEPCNADNDPYFRPGAPVTRGQLSKIVVLAAGISGNFTSQRFEDVPGGSTFYEYIENLAAEGIITGYPCGGPGEPCGPGNKPYFRPNGTASRGQLAKITANAAGYDDPVPPGTQTFADVVEGSPFHLFIERLAWRGVMQGYACGGVGEPCDDENRPYFRPAALVTRGQTSKIVSNTFYPACATGVRR